MSGVGGVSGDGEFAIQASGLTRYFGTKCAVDSLSIQVPRGSVFALLGRNGAGKTTAIRMLLGVLAPTRGRSTILGHDSACLPPAVRARIGYLTERHPIYRWMQVNQYAQFQRGTYSHWRQDIFSAVIDSFGIEPHGKAGELSQGQRAGLHLAMTLAIEPEMLILDDPATGLDPAARRSLLEAMVYFTRNGERTILFSTHLLDDVERVADHVAVLDYSVLRASCSVDTFRERVRQFVVQFGAEPPDQLHALPGLLRARRNDREWTLIVANYDGQTQRVLESMHVQSVRELPVSLEDVLIAYVGRQGSRNLLELNSKDGRP